ncbi:MAG: cyclase family protein [Acholeplasma sp.]|nr:cyclase family protein [Acholeplasma sp.]
MKLYDISVLISEDMTVYKNYDSKKPIFKNVSNHDEHGHYETDITLNVHTGTHVDFNLHMLKDGSTSSGAKLEDYITECRVIDLTHVEDGISKEDLLPFDIQKDSFVLFKTKNSWDDTFNPSFIYLKQDAAAYLSEIGIKGVGIDALGIERSQEGHPTHKLLMSKNIIILEGIHLKDIDANTYTLITLPLKLKGLDASPVRAVLIGE